MSLYSEFFFWVGDVTKQFYQMTKLSSEDYYVINIYRSESADTKMFIKDLLNLLTNDSTVIVGDFNLCFLNQRNHPIFDTLERMGFCQLVQSPTHLKGRMIDLVFSKFSFLVFQQSPFFSDHDILVLKIKEDNRTSKF